MKISILRETKTDNKGRPVENRVVLTPALVSKLKKKAPTAKVLVEKNAGAKIGFTDSDYKKAGAKITSHKEALKADLILGVKETQMRDFKFLSGKSIFMSYQHFAESKVRSLFALRSGATFICYETMEKRSWGKSYFPCLAPMSEAAGRIVARHADWFALRSQKIIGGAPVTILGAGTVGRAAAEEFRKRGYKVRLIDRSNLKNLASAIKGSLFAVSSMYTAGRSPQKLITKKLLKTMAAGGCVYPVDIDQGGGIEGAFQTSILEAFELKKIKGTDIHCFAPPNLPSLGARTTSEALGSAILPYVIDILNLGLKKAAEKNLSIRTGINIEAGKAVHPGLASSFSQRS